VLELLTSIPNLALVAIALVLGLLGLVIVPPMSQPVLVLSPSIKLVVEPLVQDRKPPLVPVVVSQQRQLPALAIPFPNSNILTGRPWLLEIQFVHTLCQRTRLSVVFLPPSPTELNVYPSVLLFWIVMIIMLVLKISAIQVQLPLLLLLNIADMFLLLLPVLLSLPNVLPELAMSLKDASILLRPFVMITASVPKMFVMMPWDVNTHRALTRLPAPQLINVTPLNAIHLSAVFNHNFSVMLLITVLFLDVTLTGITPPMPASTCADVPLQLQNVTGSKSVVLTPPWSLV